MVCVLPLVLSKAIFVTSSLYTNSSTLVLPCHFPFFSDNQRSFMDVPNSTNQEVSLEVFPYLQVLKDGTVQRLAGTEVVPAGLDSHTGVLSKDITIIPETGVTARLYRPNVIDEHQKLPLVIYFHGGAFCIATTAEPKYHASLNRLVAEAKAVVVSVNYRLAPEHPLPAAYEDSWAALEWVAEKGMEEEWINEFVDFEKVFLAGDSAGSNIAHHLVLRIKDSDLGRVMKVSGILMIHPYFWGKEAIGSEVNDQFRKGMVDKWWEFVCPSDKGGDDPWINPFADGAPDLKGLACEKILVVVAEKDILRDRGWLYYERLSNSGWEGVAEFLETQGVDHVFHIFDPDSEAARGLMKSLASFLHHGKANV